MPLLPVRCNFLILIQRCQKWKNLEISLGGGKWEIHMENISPACVEKFLSSYKDARHDEICKYRPVVI